MNIFIHTEHPLNHKTGIATDSYHLYQAICKLFENSIEKDQKKDRFDDIIIQVNQLSRFKKYFFQSMIEKSKGIHIYTQIPPRPLFQLEVNYRRAIFRVHDIFPAIVPGYYSLISRVSFRLRLSSLSRARYLIANSRETQDAISNLIKTESKVFVSNCITPSIRNVDQIVLQSLNSGVMSERITSKYILSVSAVVKRKRLIQLIDFWKSKLRSHGHSLVLVGDGSDKDIKKFLSKAVASYSLSDPKIYWFDSVTDDELIDLYRNAQGFLTTSLYEGYNMPLRDAIAFDLPVIIPPNVYRREELSYSGVESKIIELQNFEKFKDLFETKSNISRELLAKNFSVELTRQYTMLSQVVDQIFSHIIDDSRSVIM